MKTEQLLRQQLEKRLKRLKDRQSTLSAEIALVEELLANSEKDSFSSALRLRKNSVGKWSLQARVKTFLREAACPVRAKHLFEMARKLDPSLKSATFRSHLKRMADSGIILQDGPRGYYRLAESRGAETRELEPIPRRKIRVNNFYR